MSEIMRKVLSEGTTPIMTNEGLLQLFNFYYDRCERKVAFDGEFDGFKGGPSRRVILSTSKPRIDDFDFDRIAVETHTDKEFRKIYGSKYEGSIINDFPFGVFHPSDSSSGAAYDNRIYINAPFGKVRYDFMVLYAKKCKERGIPCGAKFFEKEADTPVVDNMVLYCIHENLNANLEILEEIKIELPEFAECCGSPIASGLNYSYYAVCHYGDKIATYNIWFNKLSCKAFAITLAQMIKESNEFYQTLNEHEKNIIDILINPESLIGAVKKSKVNDSSCIIKTGVHGIDLGKDGSRICQQIFEKFVSSNPELIESDIIIKLKEQIQTIASLNGFGDTEHKDLPISIRESDYLALGIEPKSIETKSEEILTKTSVSKEKYLSLLKAGRVKLAIELANMGLKAEIEGKTKEELREMLFARIELDDESIIDILSGETEQLCQFVDALGKDDEYEHRSEYEERFIELMGVDKVIDAAYSVRDKDAQLGRNRKWRFKDSLRSVRLARGKLIFESEEFQKLKTREQRNEFIKNFSEHAKYDVEEYYDLYGKSSTYSK